MVPTESSSPGKCSDNDREAETSLGASPSGAKGLCIGLVLGVAHLSLLCQNPRADSLSGEQPALSNPVYLTHFIFCPTITWKMLENQTPDNYLRRMGVA